MKASKLKKILAVSGFALFAATGAAHADGWYIGGAAGLSKNNANSDNVFFNPSLCTTTHTCTADQKSLAFQLFVGKQLNPYLALEFGFTSLGKTADFAYSQPFSTGTLVQNTSAVFLALVAKHELGASPVSIFGKAGVAVWRGKMTFDRTPDSVSFYDRSVTNFGVSPILGIGLEWDTGTPVKLRVGLDRYFAVGKRTQPFDVGNNTITTARTGVNMLYVGATFGF